MCICFQAALERDSTGAVRQAVSCSASEVKCFPCWPRTLAYSLVRPLVLPPVTVILVVLWTRCMCGVEISGKV